MMQSLIDLLDRESYSCVVANGYLGECGVDGVGVWREVRHFSMRGVADLHRLRNEEPESLRGAYVVDKVVGKGAAAIMASCGVKRLFTYVLSDGAYDLLVGAGVDVEFVERVPHIINREGSGWCPVEWRCRDTERVEEILPIVDGFIAEMRRLAIG